MFSMFLRFYVFRVWGFKVFVFRVLRIHAVALDVMFPSFDLKHQPQVLKLTNT